MATHIPKGREAESLSIGPHWVVIDAAGHVLGRVATVVARGLIGQDKPNFPPYLDCGDHVVVINAQKIRLTGNKIEQKIYRTHSGFPGGLKEVPAKRLRANRADWMVREAVLGMLPKNKLRASRAKKTARLSGRKAWRGTPDKSRSRWRNSKGDPRRNALGLGSRNEEK